MKCSITFWGLTLTLKTNMGGSVLGFSHLGSPTQRYSCSSSLWHIAHWEGAALIRKCSVTPGNLVKRKMFVKKSSWKELYLPLTLLLG